MKQRSPTQGLSMAHFRRQQLVAASGGVWLFNLGIHVASILRSVLTLVYGGHSVLQAFLEVVNTITHFSGHSLPSAAARLRRPDLVQAACITAHVTNSVLLWLIGLGLILFPTAMRGFLQIKCLGLHAEILIEVILTYQYQLSLPIMALLHAFRQAAWMSVIFWRMDGELNRLLVRGLGNWMLMMLLSSFLEMRLRAAHRRACGVMGQQQEQRPQPEQQPGMSWAHSQLPDNIDDTAYEIWSVPKPQPQSCVGAASKPGADCTRDGPSKLEGTMEPQATVRGAVTAFPGQTGTQLPVPAVPAPASAALGMSVLPGVRKARLAPHQQQAAQATLKTIKSEYTSSYKRGRHGGSSTVLVKIEGLELEHLPPDLPGLLQKQLSYCMPGVTMKGLALRSGCVMLTLDLAHYEEEGAAVLIADNMQDLVTRLMQSQAMGQVLEDGAPMCIQMADELALCRWNSASGSYTSEGAPALDSSDWYSCCMVSAGPAVHCPPDNDKHTSATFDVAPACHQLTLTVELELPSNCQLHGWQPAGGFAPSGSSLPQNGTVLDAMLLARRLDGGYLPVVVQQVPCICKASGDTTPQNITVQVVVSVAGEGPAALHLELWCKQADAAGRAVGGTNNQLSWVPGHMPGLELLMAHMPLLVLPSSWKEAAAELLQHIDDIGGVQPQHALPLGSTSVNSRLSMNMYSAQDLGPATSSLHGIPPAVGQSVVNTDETGSGQPMHQKHSAQASDSASSHNPARNHQPFNAVDDDPVCCLLEDLGALLTHKPTACATPAAVPDDVISQLGDDLLVYAVQHGLVSVASLIVDTMQRIEQHGAASTAVRPAIVSPSAWLLRVAGCASNSDSDGQPGGIGGCMSLLHAAMASGSAEMLGQVFRWGTLYGGRDWAWPWELENAAGCSALHLAAAQPAAGACAALLKTITCMLPAAQVQAARSTWLHCQGGLGSTPAQLFALASNGGYAGEMWSSDAPVHASHSLASAQPDTATTTSAGAGPSAASSSGSPPATTSAATMETPSTQSQSWLGSMVEVWTSREPEEYHAWAKRQDSLSIWYWAVALFAMSAACMHRSAVAGCWQYEWLHLSFYTWFMIPAVVATAGDHEWLGSKKVWTVLAKVMPICSWLAKAQVPNHQAATWISAGTTGADMIYVLLLGVAIDKIPMPQLVLSRVIEALAHGHAYKTAGFPYPFWRALAVHSIALMLSVVIRTRKLRAFYRWQAKQQDLRQRGWALPCAAKEPHGRKQS